MSETHVDFEKELNENLTRLSRISIGVSGPNTVKNPPAVAPMTIIKKKAKRRTKKRKTLPKPKKSAKRGKVKPCNDSTDWFDEIQDYKTWNKSMKCWDTKTNGLVDCPKPEKGNPQMMVKIKWTGYDKATWIPKHEVDDGELKKFTQSRYKKLGFVEFIQKESASKQKWLDTLKKKILVRCKDANTKVLPWCQQTWNEENKKQDSLDVLDEWQQKLKRLKHERMLKAKWEIAPFCPPTQDPITEPYTKMDSKRFRNTFTHLLTCVEALILSGEVEVGTSFKGRVNELSWQTRFYEVLKFIGDQGTTLKDGTPTKNVYENQTSIGIDSRKTDFFLTNRGLDFEFYEVVGELKNTYSPPFKVFKNLHGYLQQRWKYLPPIVQTRNTEILHEKEPIGLIMINESINMKTQGGSYEIFCPVPYVLWNRNKDGARPETETMIDEFDRHFGNKINFQQINTMTNRLYNKSLTESQNLYEAKYDTSFYIKQFTVDYLKDKRIERKTGNVSYLVKWKDYGDSSNTWEPAENLPDESKNIYEKIYTKSSRKKRSRTSSRFMVGDMVPTRYGWHQTVPYHDETSSRWISF